MERSELIAVIAKSIVDVRRGEVPDLTEDVRLLEDLHFDSTAILELLMSLEDTLAIEIDAETLSMDNFASVGTLADYLTTMLRTPA